MEIIISHRNMDFDALACQVAASKLYPKAIRVSAGKLPPIIQNYLSLHMDKFELTPVKEIDLQKVTRVVVVDVRNMNRLKDYEILWNRLREGDDSLEVHIYDHHPHSSNDLIGHHVKVEETGAATTLLVEELMEKKLPLTPVEATALALGIYADTGSLTYSSTTVRDVEAAAALLKNGAKMGILRFFLHTPLGARQLALLTRILTESEQVDINGMQYGVAAFNMDQRVDGLADVVSEALLLSGREGLFALFCTNSTVNLIGRSWRPQIDVGRVMARLGGGGHHGAGSVTLKKTSLEEAKALLLETLKEDPPKPIFVKEVMANDVIRLPHDMVLEEARKLFKEKQISGAPVFKEGKMKGILSKRDIRKAVKANRTHLPVSSCMSQNVRTIEGNRSLLRAFETMSKFHVGRLPVMDGDQLLGIITRNDILNVVYN